MRRTIALTSCLFVAACASPADAPGELQPADFAEGLAIDAPAGSPFFRVDLPEAVLSGTAWPDLRDIRVFNAASQSVPFARSAPTVVAPETRRIPLQTFRLESIRPGGTPEVSLDAHQRGIQLRVAPSSAPDTSAEYLLAVQDPNLQSPIERLWLEWEPVEKNWQQRVTVAVSNDLESWRTIASSRPLIDMKARDGQRLQHRDVAVERHSPQSARYWRLRFGSGFSPRLTSVEAEVSREAAPAPGVVLPAASSAESNGWVTYTLASAQPIARIRLTPMDVNSVLPMLIEGRQAGNQAWQTIARTMVYRLNSTSGEQYSDPIGLGGRVLQSIRLRPIDTSWGAPPQVEIERDPVMLVVNARGAGPFLLAWGSRAAHDVSVPYDSLVPAAVGGTALDIEAGRFGAGRTLGGSARLTEPAPAERAAQWQTSLVWVLLVGGAGALGMLALRVWRESQVKT